MKTYADIKGDGGSQVVEQVVALRKQIAERLSGVGELLAIGSAKGGVGKSTLTYQLASALKRRGKRVALLDLDFNGPSLAKLAGVEGALFLPGENGLLLPRNDEGIGVFSFGSIFAEDSAVEFDSVAPNESHTWRQTKEFSTLADILSKTEWGELDFLLLDLPPGAERTYQYADFFGPSLKLLLVTIPSELSRGVVRRGVNSLSKLENSIVGYIENMAGYYMEDTGELRTLFPKKEVEELGIPKLASLPFDPALAEAGDRGQSLSKFPESPVWKTILEIADHLADQVEEK